MNIIDALVLKSLEGVGDSSITKILEFTSQQCINSLEELAHFGVESIPLRRVPSSLREFIKTGEFKDVRLKTENELKAWADQEIFAIHRNSVQYPKQLLDLVDPPPFLFCKGNLDLLSDTRAIAVVGTRNNTSKGALIAAKTVEAFHTHKFLIVSGLALGIDAIAHKAALECGAPTIAVLVDVIKISPTTNKGLAEEILQKGGLLISENKPSMPIVAALFAKRDRIQAGLSTAVFAIETSKDGGTMHAVRAARKMGRPVFVPDAIAAKYNDLTLDAIRGTQYLVESGEARPYTSQLYEGMAEELEGISQRLKSMATNEAQGGSLL
ncbi:DNA-processing protein DprA [Marinobacterium weihaiense]|uniref:DNA-protecting protein DprA n=1 Tax=Marinobacterium weihaiense TaxID=2851016 RepID=A0ABS6MEC6_9GAMM|nr:DNA-processing protein DprA [Marinobacterium weihaiense]MBV0934181.1 DNA-protecting protein DprA [Marinobacterium weihaiense]